MANIQRETLIGLRHSCCFAYENVKQNTVLIITFYGGLNSKNTIFGSSVIVTDNANYNICTNTIEKKFHLKRKIKLTKS